MTERTRHFLPDLASLIALCGAVFYGLGLAYTWGLTRSIPVRPEEVGLTSSFLVPRAAIMTGGLAVTLLLLSLLTGSSAPLERGRNGDLRLFHRILWVAVPAYLCLNFYVWITSDLPNAAFLGQWFLAVPLSLFMTVLGLALTLRGFGYGPRNLNGPSLSTTLSLIHLAGVAALVTISLGVLSFGFGERGAADIRSGRALGWPIETFFVSFEDSNETACGLLLGTADEVHKIWVLSDADLVRVPVGTQLVSEEDCSGSP